jgi:hypothetical protein
MPTPPTVKLGKVEGVKSCGGICEGERRVRKWGSGWCVIWIELRRWWGKVVPEGKPGSEERRGGFSASKQMPSFPHSHFYLWRNSGSNSTYVHCTTDWGRETISLRSTIEKSEFPITLLLPTANYWFVFIRNGNKGHILGSLTQRRLESLQLLAYT